MRSNPKEPGIPGRMLAADPLPWAAWLLLRRICSKIKSRYMGWIFHAPGLYLGPGCIIRGSRFIRFGSKVYAHGHLWLEAVAYYRNQRFTPRIEIGDEVSFSEGVHISCIEQIVIGKHVLFGSRVYISDHNHGVYQGPLQSPPDDSPAHRQLGGGGPVDIGDHVWIGDNVVIVGPVSIGCGSIIGANSVVRKNVTDRTMVAGIPAKVLKSFNAQTSQWERS